MPYSATGVAHGFITGKVQSSAVSRNSKHGARITQHASLLTIGILKRILAIRRGTAIGGLALLAAEELPMEKLSRRRFLEDSLLALAAASVPAAALGSERIPDRGRKLGPNDTIRIACIG